MEIKATIKVCGGTLTRFTHQSVETKTPMTCAVFVPPSPTASGTAATTFPTLLYLSGLTCTDENVCQKGAPFRKLAELGVAFVAPDTSPRGAGVPTAPPGEEASWDFGVGAGFYLDATAEPWANNYRMYSYVTQELLAVVKEHFPTLDLTRLGVMGHSMGGHGALTVALKNQGLFKSVSAFAPICHPTQCPWGQKAFRHYLARPADEAADYDATALVGALGGKATAYDDILVDVGSADTFLIAGQLLPAAFADACAAVGQKVTLRYQEGYDHSYFFVSTFIDEHIEFHATRLRC